MFPLLYVVSYWRVPGFCEILENERWNSGQKRRFSDLVWESAPIHPHLGKLSKKKCFFRPSLIMIIISSNIMSERPEVLWRLFLIYFSIDCWYHSGCKIWCPINQKMHSLTFPFLSQFGWIFGNFPGPVKVHLQNFHFVPLPAERGSTSPEDEIIFNSTFKLCKSERGLFP